MDNKSKTAPQDAQRVNVNEDYEVRYWSDKFKVSPDELKQAVKSAGVMAKDVERHLQGGKR